MITEEIEKIKDMEPDEFLDNFLKIFINSENGANFPKMSDTVNKKRVKDVLYVYKLMQKMFKKDPNVEISFKLHEPFRGTGSVSVVGKNIKFNNGVGFMQGMEKADNFEAYALTNGNTKITFTFLGLMLYKEEI